MSEYTKNARTQMEKGIDALKNNFTKVRTGRANAHVLDDIKVDYYGQLTPVTQLAGIKGPQGDREGHRDLRPRHHPEQRRRLHPPSLPEAHGGEAQGARQGVRQVRGGRQGRHQERPS